MAELPKPVSATKIRLDSITFPKRRGRTIGMSSIGDPCARRLWFKLHWANDPEPIPLRLFNLFETGTRAEEFIIKDLERIGITVTNRQEELWGFMDHAHGFTDGRCENVPEAPKTTHLLEMKTHNDNYFKQLLKKGVKDAFPMHYAQCQRYMHGTDLKRCLYIGYNKNTSEYYVERIRFDQSFAEDLIRKERDIILSEDAPHKQFEPSWYECKYCDFRPQCHENAPPAKNCRTCVHSDLASEGKWMCCVSGNEEYEIPYDIQVTGCHLYKQIKIL